MDAITLMLDLAQRPLDAAGSLRPQLTHEKLNAHPGGHDNSIAWLLWHTAREIDAQVAQLSGDEPIWTAQGFDARFGLDVDDDETGFGHSPEQARAVVVTDVALLFEHLEAAVAAQKAYISSLSAADLDDVVDESWDPPVTRAARLVSCTEDALLHLGQALYVAGMTSLEG